MKVLSDHFDNFVVYWRLREISMNFRVSPETPQVECTGALQGKLVVEGSLLPTDPRLADLRSDEFTRLVNCQEPMTDLLSETFDL